jgi:hypothetical protein
MRQPRSCRSTSSTSKLSIIAAVGRRTWPYRLNTGNAEQRVGGSPATPPCCPACRRAGRAGGRRRRSGGCPGRAARASRAWVRSAVTEAGWASRATEFPGGRFAQLGAEPDPELEAAAGGRALHRRRVNACERTARAIGGEAVGLPLAVRREVELPVGRVVRAGDEGFETGMAPQAVHPARGRPLRHPDERHVSREEIVQGKALARQREDAGAQFQSLADRAIGMGKEAARRCHGAEAGARQDSNPRHPVRARSKKGFFTQPYHGPSRSSAVSDTR